jgi:uncharacterized membrane protein YdjX (TVP38/TMEM64 family)
MNMQICSTVTRLTRPGNISKAGRLLAILSILWIFRAPLNAFFQFISDRQQVMTFVANFGPSGPVILFLLLFAQVFVAVIPGHALMMTGGYVYGFVEGILITTISTVIASQAAFLIARIHGRKVIDRLASPGIIQRWDRMAANQGALFYFFAFVLPIFPSDLMCYVAGLGKISPRRFFVANLSGRALCAISITMIGAFGFQPPVWFWIVALGSMTAFFAGWLIYKKLYVR